MGYFKWTIGGFALLALARFVEAIGDLGTTPGQRLPVYLFALLLLAGAGYCFVKSWRGAWAAMPWNSVKATS